jgi:hypothetical protein
VLDSVLQARPCRVEPVGRLLRIHGGSDRPAIVAAIKRTGGQRAGSRAFWWIEARQLRRLADDLRQVPDLLARATRRSPSEEALADQSSPSYFATQHIRAHRLHIAGNGHLSLEG